jgi:hypothetical protein
MGLTCGEKILQQAEFKNLHPDIHVIPHFKFGYWISRLTGKWQYKFLFFRLKELLKLCN